MVSSEHDRSRIQAQEIHGARLKQLIDLGVLELLIKHCSPNQIGGDVTQLDLGFKGEPIVRISASRSKTGQHFYREDVEVTYDGQTLSVEGAHSVFSGSIPAKETKSKKVIGEAIRNAFQNPKRTILIDFDPRKFY